MRRALVFRDVHGRGVPLARLPTSGQVDGLGFLKAKNLRKMWNKYRKPIVGGALVTGAIVGAAYTGGATLTALPALLGTATKGGGKAINAAGGPEAVMSAAGSLVGGRDVIPADRLTDTGSPAPAHWVRRSGDPRAMGLAMPLLFGGGLAVLALVVLMHQRAALSSPRQGRRP
jgi:hypothetical protein